ncbi:MAG: SH3 domain-containing protein [Solibacillus sp.]
MFRNIFLIILTALLLAACGSGDEESTKDSSVIDKGLAAVAANDLGKAEGIFESATDNPTAQSYYEQIALLRVGKSQLESGQVAEGNANLEMAASFEGGSELMTELANDLLASGTKAEQTTKEEEEKAKETEATQAEVEPKPEPKQAADVIADQASGMSYVQLAEAEGNVREQPSVDSKLVHSGKQGDVFVYLQEKVNTSDGRTWYKVEYGSGSVGYISRAVSNLTNEFPSYVRLIENGTNIRSEPSINAPVIHTGQKNDTFYFSADKTYTQDGRTWLHIWLPNDQYGYVSQKVATMTTAYTPSVHSTYYGATIVITGESANVRAYPSIDSTIVVKNLKRGETLTYTGYSYETSDGRTWYEVEISNGYGYISKAVGKIQ